MIQYTIGNIFNSPAQTIVNPVNTVGVMGAGLAKQFKDRYPNMFTKYKSACDNKLFDVGKLMLIHEQDHMVLLFPTKRHFAYQSQLGYIEAGLKRFAHIYKEKGIQSIAFPRLGCGLGGLDWEQQVKPIMEKYLGSLPITVYIYA